MYLLTDGSKNPKTRKKCNKYQSAILHLAPAKLSGHEVCRGRSPLCTKFCLNKSGAGGLFHKVQRARKKRTKLLFENPSKFYKLLELDLEYLKLLAEERGVKPVCRLNGTSDLDFAHFIKNWPQITFWDYTKVASRCRNNRLKNYHLTFSLHEKNKRVGLRLLAEGVCNVAVVFYEKRPRTWEGYPVISGENSDYRFEDPEGVVVGLRYKKIRGHKGKFLRMTLKEQTWMI